MSEDCHSGNCEHGIPLTQGCVVCGRHQMPSEVAKSIVKGLEDAVAFSAGDEDRGRVVFPRSVEAQLTDLALDNINVDIRSRALRCAVRSAGAWQSLTFEDHLKRTLEFARAFESYIKEGSDG